MSQKQTRDKYTLEFKLEAVRLVKGGQAAAVTAKVLGIPKASLSNWVRLSDRGALSGAGDKGRDARADGAGQAEGGAGAHDDGARHRKKAAAYFAQDFLKVRLDSSGERGVANQPVV
jgi:transposase